MRLSFIDIAKNLRKTTRNSNSTVLGWATMGDETQKVLVPCRVAKGSTVCITWCYTTVAVASCFPQKT